MTVNLALPFSGVFHSPPHPCNVTGLRPAFVILMRTSGVGTGIFTGGKQ